MHSSERMNLQLLKIPTKFENAGRVFIQEGLSAEIIECYETFVRPWGTQEIESWYGQHQQRTHARPAIQFIDLVEYLAGVDEYPFHQFSSRCHALDKKPPVWFESNSSWEHCAINTAVKIRNMVSCDCTEESLFNALCDVADSIHQGMWSHSFSPPGSGIHNARAWARQCSACEAADHLVQMCNLMDELEIF